MSRSAKRHGETRLALRHGLFSSPRGCRFSHPLPVFPSRPRVPGSASPTDTRSRVVSSRALSVVTSRGALKAPTRESSPYSSSFALPSHLRVLFAGIADGRERERVAATTTEVASSQLAAGEKRSLHRGSLRSRPGSPKAFSLHPFLPFARSRWCLL